MLVNKANTINSRKFVFSFASNIDGDATVQVLLLQTHFSRVFKVYS